MNMDRQKRHYHNPVQFIRDCLFLLKRVKHFKYAWLIAKPVILPCLRRNEISDANNKLMISPQLRERLLLAVTSVNSCSACSYVHTQVALTEGISQLEIQQILEGDLSTCPEEEIVALLYAQHWADKNSMADFEVKNRFYNHYGHKKSEAIEFCMGAIKIGNLMANTVEYLKYRVLVLKHK